MLSSDSNGVRSRFRVGVLLPHPTPYRSPMFDRVAERGEFDLEVLYCERGGPERPWDAGSFLDLYSRFLHGRRFRLGKRVFRWNPAIVRELLRRSYDLVFMGGYSDITMFVAATWCLLFGVPYGFIMESHLLRHRSSLVRVVKWPILRLLIGRTTVNLPVGSAARDYLLRYGAPANGMFFFPNTCDVPYYIRHIEGLRTRLTSLRRELNLSRYPVVTYVGRLAPEKNLMLLLEAWRALELSRLAPQLVIIGDGPERERLQEYVIANRLKDVHFTGFVQPSDLLKYYAVSDVFVLPSVDEPWGAVVTEAMAAGLPVIVSRQVGAAQDLVRHEYNGFITSESDMCELSQALTRLLGDDELRTQMGQRSREMIQDWGFDVGVDNFVRAVHFVQKPLASEERSDTKEADRGTAGK